MENKKMNLHPEMSDELRSLILDFEGVLNRLSEYAKEHDTQRNDEIDPANYFAYKLSCFYAQENNQLMHQLSRCISRQDFVEALKEELNALI